MREGKGLVGTAKLEAGYRHELTRRQFDVTDPAKLNAICKSNEQEEGCNVLNFIKDGKELEGLAHIYATSCR
jgi:hypothetical protein